MSKDELIELLADLPLGCFKFLSADLNSGRVTLEYKDLALEITSIDVSLYTFWEGEDGCIASLDVPEGTEINEDFMCGMLRDLCEEAIEYVGDC